MTTEPEDDLEQLLDRIPLLRGRVRVEELSGGLTNHNVRVVTADGDYVVRRSGSDVDLLGIDRDAEHANTGAAHAAGVGAEVHDYRPDLGVLVIGYLDGTTLDDDAFADPGVLARAADACRRLHAGPRFEGDLDMFARQAGYLATVRERGFDVPAGYHDHGDAWRDVERVVRSRPVASVPCNNDLLAGNFIDDGEQVWLIDYEYSGNHDAAFELGNTCTECEFPPERVEAYTEAYHGSPTRGDLARVRLGMLRSEYGWALWGFIQAATSPLDFDFHGWGSHRYERAARTFTSDGFARLLEEAAGD